MNREKELNGFINIRIQWRNIKNKNDFVCQLFQRLKTKLALINDTDNVFCFYKYKKWNVINNFHSFISNMMIYNYFNWVLNPNFRIIEEIYINLNKKENINKKKIYEVSYKNVSCLNDKIKEIIKIFEEKIKNNKKKLIEYPNKYYSFINDVYDLEKKQWITLSKIKNKYYFRITNKTQYIKIDEQFQKKYESNYFKSLFYCKDDYYSFLDQLVLALINYNEDRLVMIPGLQQIYRMLYIIFPDNLALFEGKISYKKNNQDFNKCNLKEFNSSLLNEENIIYQFKPYFKANNSIEYLNFNKLPNGFKFIVYNNKAEIINLKPWFIDKIYDFDINKNKDIKRDNKLVDKYNIDNVRNNRFRSLTCGCNDFGDHNDRSIFMSVLFSILIERLNIITFPFKNIINKNLEYNREKYYINCRYLPYYINKLLKYEPNGEIDFKQLFVNVKKFINQYDANFSNKINKNMIIDALLEDKKLRNNFLVENNVIKNFTFV
jgi:hypothetical protein